MLAVSPSVTIINDTVHSIMPVNNYFFLHCNSGGGKSGAIKKFIAAVAPLKYSKIFSDGISKSG